MTLSKPFTFVYRGQPARLFVIRGSEKAFGRIALEDGSQLDVEHSDDIHELTDDEAAAALIKAADDDANILGAQNPAGI